MTVQYLEIEMLIDIINGAKSPNEIAYIALTSKSVPESKLYNEMIDTHANMKNIPTRNLISSFSLKRNLKMIEVNTQ